MPDEAGVIVRTAAEGASEEELRRDVERLAAQWEDIAGEGARRPSARRRCCYGEPDLTIRVVRDIFNEDFSKLVVVRATRPGRPIDDVRRPTSPRTSHDRLEQWTGDQRRVRPSSASTSSSLKALDRKVWLPSGGSLVIDRTEAMTVVDVNTGKFTGQGGNLEETVTENNLEAAEEIVRQLRLRDIGGIIVIDFIDMVLESNRDLVLRRLLECLGRDRTKHQVAEVTSLGLVQMTRKRIGQGLLEVFCEPCEACNGRGFHVHNEPVAAQARRGDGPRRSPTAAPGHRQAQGHRQRRQRHGRQRPKGNEGEDDRRPPRQRSSRGSSTRRRRRRWSRSDAAAAKAAADDAASGTGASDGGPEAGAAPCRARGCLRGPRGRGRGEGACGRHGARQAHPRPPQATRKAGPAAAPDAADGGSGGAIVTRATVG